MEKEIQTQSPQRLPYRNFNKNEGKQGAHSPLNRNLMEFASHETGRHYSDHDNRLQSQHDRASLPTIIDSNKGNVHSVNYSLSPLSEREELFRKKKTEKKKRKSHLIKVMITLGILAVVVAILDILLIVVFDVHFYLDGDPKGQRATYQPYVTVDLIIMGIALMVFDYPPEVVMLSLAFLYYIADCQTLQETLNGFANKGVIAVCLLCVVAKGINETKSLDGIFKFVLGSSKSIVLGQLRLYVLAIVFSAFINNTPLVAILIPLIESWCITNEMPKKAFLLPLSIMSILGGGCSQIGSSVNIIAINKAEENKDWDPSKSIGFFEIGYVGLPVAFIGACYMMIFAFPCLEGRKKKKAPDTEGGNYEALVESGASQPGHSNGYWVIVEVVNVKQKSPIQLGMHNVLLCDLVAIQRNANDEIVRGEEIYKIPLHYKDLLIYFAHSGSGVVALRCYKGVRLSVHRPLSRLGQKRRHRVLFELIISAGSSLEERTPREEDFLYKYDACIISIRRKGEPICRYSFEDFPLRAGDCLLVQASASNLSSFKQNFDFTLCSAVPQSKPPRFSTAKDLTRQLTGIILLIAMVLLSTFDVTDISFSAFVICIVFLLNKTLTLQEAKAASNPDVFLVLAGSIGVAAGLQNSGAMQALASGLVTLGSKVGTLMVIFLIYFCTLLLSLVVTNAACVVIMIPIAFTAAKQLDLPQKLFVFLIIFASSAGFSTPYAYQTNLMVMKPGGYKFLDYVKIGLPLNVILMVCTSLLCYFIYG